MALAMNVDVLERIDSTKALDLDGGNPHSSQRHAEDQRRDGDESETTVSTVLGHLEGDVSSLGRKKKRKLTTKQKKKVKEYVLPSFVYGGDKVDLPPIMLCPKLSRMLKPHQKEGLRWLWTHFGRGEDSCGCMLADHMGLGKTIQTIALICAMMGCGTEELLDEEDQEETSSSSNLVASTASTIPASKRSRTTQSKDGQPLAKCVLVLVPKTVADVWVNQTRKFLGWKCA